GNSTITDETLSFILFLPMSYIYCSPTQKNRGKMKKSIDSGGGSCYTINCSGGERDTKYGGIAQLGERLNGIQEVSGSIPLISTIGKPTTTEYGLCGGIAQLGACVIENMPPLSDQQSTTSYSVPYK